MGGDENYTILRYKYSKRTTFRGYSRSGGTKGGGLKGWHACINGPSARRML